MGHSPIWQFVVTLLSAKGQLDRWTASSWKCLSVCLLPNKDAQGEQEGTTTKKFWACRHGHPKQTNWIKRTLRIHGLFSGAILLFFFLISAWGGAFCAKSGGMLSFHAKQNLFKFWFSLKELINNWSKVLSSILACFMVRIWSTQIANILIPLNKMKLSIKNMDIYNIKLFFRILAFNW